jgi:hypothetical protein
MFGMGETVVTVRATRLRASASLSARHGGVCDTPEVVCAGHAIVTGERETTCGAQMILFARHGGLCGTPGVLCEGHAIVAGALTILLARHVTVFEAP